MGFLSGALTVRRFRVVGTLPDDFRDVFRERLQEFAFHEPPVELGKEEIEGWVQVHNLLDTEFDDFNKWLYNDFVLIALRVDKKSLPAKLFAAHLQKECEAWCAEREQTRCLPSVKAEIKDRMETEWLKRTLPRVGMTELCWNIESGYLVLHTLSEGTAERVRKRFFRTFGMKLIPWSPLDWLGESTDVDAVLATTPTFVEG